MSVFNQRFVSVSVPVSSDIGMCVYEETFVYVDLSYIYVLDRREVGTGIVGNRRKAKAKAKAPPKTLISLTVLIG